MKICFLTKKEKPHVKDAISYLDKISTRIDVYDESGIKDFPNQVINTNYDMIIAYITGWIVPNPVLQNTIKWNLNFHPGPPEYPGTGCFNFAIYDEAKEYGSTVNIMEPAVDTGEIVAVDRFLINDNETVETLSKKTYKSIFKLFKTVVDKIHYDNSLPKSDEIWTRKPYKRVDLEKLCEINHGMKYDEVNKRIRSTYLKGKPAPFIELGGYRFEYNPDR